MKSRVQTFAKYSVIGVLVFNLGMAPAFVFAENTPPTPPPAPENTMVQTPPPVSPPAPTAPGDTKSGETVNPTSGSVAGPTSDNSGSPTQITMPDGQTVTVRANPLDLIGDPSNTNTGADSNNTASETANSQTDVGNSNKANIQNEIVANSSSGNNEASKNTGDGSVSTGDSNLILTLLNLANTNFIALPGGEIVFFFKNILSNLLGNFLVDPVSGETYSLTGSRVDATNSNTGADSKNNASVELGNQTLITNTNDANLNNNLVLNSNTGNNEASKNTGNGSVTTGDSNVSLNLLNFLNSNFIVSGQGVIGVLNIFGNWLGDLLLPKGLASVGGGSGGGEVTVKNGNTGAGSENNAGVTATNTTKIENANDANTQNQITVNSNTGGNSAGENTGSGSVATGVSSISLTLQNFANQNFVGDTMVFILVNVLGKWTGLNLVSLGNSGTTSGGNLKVENSNTGFGYEMPVSHPDLCVECSNSPLESTSGFSEY